MRPALFATLLALLAVGCSDQPGNPLAPTPDLRVGDGTDAAAATLTLIPVPGSGSRAFGAMRVVVGVDVPPNPCLREAARVEGAVVDFCAVIVKPGRETIESGSIALRDETSGTATVLPFRVHLPPSPCLILRVVGTLPLNTGSQPGPPNIVASFKTSEGSIAGNVPGPPTVGLNPGPPNCTVGVTAETPFTVAAFGLRPDDGSESQAFGRMWVAVGAEAPPNPCLDATRIAEPAVSFCALLVNPARETLQSGSIAIAGATRDEAIVLPFRFTLPPNPCLVLRVAGTLALGTGVTPGPPDVSASLLTSAGSIGGATGVQPGPPTIEQNPGPPTVCAVTATTG